MNDIKLPDVRIAEAVAVTPGLVNNGIKVTHCKISGTIGTELRFTVLLPENWNERLFVGGNGGFAGSVQNQAVASLNAGYATAGTDTGHQGASNEAKWALGHVERQVNFGHLAIHRVTEVAKVLLREHYGTDPRYSYFFGCSNGGRQALMASQRYPEDFDGIVAMAPALNFTRTAVSYMKNAQALSLNAKAIAATPITADNLRLLEAKILAACDAIDGVKDGVMEDPRECKFKVADIPICADAQPGRDCLTKAQRQTIERIYAPAMNGEEQVYDGQPFGGESEVDGWQKWIIGSNEKSFPGTTGQVPGWQWTFGTEFFKYFVFGDPDWNHTQFDITTWRRDVTAVAKLLNADNPDLSRFKGRRGKLILAHGWSDPAINPLASIDYYQAVESRDPGVRSYFRLLMMPGVLHCAGGPGTDKVDWFTTIADWVERNKAPDRVSAMKADANGNAIRKHPLCSYPQRAVFNGRGDPNEESSYVCGER